MHKTDLIKQVANQTGLSQRESAEVTESFLKAVTKSLKKGEGLTLIGFGTFKAVKTAARKGRNPRTGKEIQIKASKRIKFTAGKALKTLVK